MIKRLSVDGLRGLVQFDQRELPAGFFTLKGPVGCGKSTFLDALLLLQEIALGKNSVAQVFAFASTLGQIPRDRCELAIVLAKGRFEYSYRLLVCFEFAGGKGFVQEEELSCDGGPYFCRHGVKVEYAAPLSASNFSLSQDVIALPMLLATDRQSPVAIFRKMLGDAFLLKPIYPWLTDEVNPFSPYLAATGAGFSSWLAAFLSARPASYGWIVDMVGKFIPNFRGFALRTDDLGVRHIYVSMRPASVEISLALLSDVEKAIFLHAAIMAYRFYDEASVCVWNEPFAMMPQPMATALAGEIQRDFGANGQFICLSTATEWDKERAFTVVDFKS